MRYHRIEYKKENKEGKSVSKVYANESGTSYYAVMNISQGYWKVFNAKSRKCLRQGSTYNKIVAQRAIKRVLLKFGVKFRVIEKGERNGNKKEANEKTGRENIS